MAPSPAILLLESIHYATNADIESLRQLVGSSNETLNDELVLRILLTYLPESCDPASYAVFVDDLLQGNISNLDDDDTPRRVDAQLEDEEAIHKAKGVQLLPLGNVQSGSAESRDLLLSFLVARAHQIESETGSLLLVQQFVGHFSRRSVALDLWIATILLPLLRLEYEYYPQEKQTYSLARFETVQNEIGLEELLSELSARKRVSGGLDWARDIKGFIAPWVYGQIQRREHNVGTGDAIVSRRESVSESSNDLWSQLDGWMLDLASRDLNSTVELLQQWDGPNDIDFGGWLESPIPRPDSTVTHYIQTALAIIYRPQGGDNKLDLDMCSAVVNRVADLAHIELPFSIRDPDLASVTTPNIEALTRSISTVHVLPNELTDPGNPLTTPGEMSLALAVALLTSSSLLSNLGEAITTDTLLSLTLFGFEADQRTTMRKILRRLSSGPNQSNLFWRDTRQKMLWLRVWCLGDHDTPESRHGIFCRIPYHEMEIEILKALATAGRFNLITDTYVKQSFPQGPTSNQIQKALLDVALSSYDNASNGNKTRGGVKKASDIINTFRPHFAQSNDFLQAHALVQATHALSFYSLILQHGVPFMPVNIRVHPNPLSLIEKVLSQNPRSYTKLDDLLEIGRNLVRAGLIKDLTDANGLHKQSEQDKLLAVERKVTAQAIGAALKEDDFDTAYSYVVSRLSPAEHMPQNGDVALSEDAVLWQAAYEAGRYRPKDGNGTVQLRRLEQRMELLSQALLLAPPSSVQEVLATWRACEEEVNASLAQEIVEEDRWNAKADRHLPGGFTGDDIVPTAHQPRNATRRAMDEEAPMGLFDVARGAASAFSRSAFPLKAQTSSRGPGDMVAGVHHGQSNDDTAPEGEERLRKRDMVSNMVTGGLASGIGWVIGAPATRQE